MLPGPRCHVSDIAVRLVLSAMKLSPVYYFTVAFWFPSFYFSKCLGLGHRVSDVIYCVWGPFVTPIAGKLVLT